MKNFGSQNTQEIQHKTKFIITLHNIHHSQLLFFVTKKDSNSFNEEEEDMLVFQSLI